MTVIYTGTGIECLSSDSKPNVRDGLVLVETDTGFHFTRKAGVWIRFDALEGDTSWSHITATDPHIGYRLESADHSHASTGLQGGTVDHIALSNKGTNTHAQVDTFIASKAAASGIASLDVSSKVVQEPASKAAASGIASLDSSSKLVQLRARADDGLGYVQLANDTLAQAYATNSVTKLTVTSNRTLTTTVPSAGCRAVTIILTSGTTSWTITFGTGFKPTGTLATGITSGRVFVVEWISDGTNLYESSRTVAMVA